MCPLYMEVSTLNAGFPLYVWKYMCIASSLAYVKVEEKKGNTNKQYTQSHEHTGTCTLVISCKRHVHVHVHVFVAQIVQSSCSPYIATNASAYSSSSVNNFLHLFFCFVTSTEWIIIQRILSEDLCEENKEGGSEEWGSGGGGGIAKRA